MSKICLLSENPRLIFVLSICMGDNPQAETCGLSPLQMDKPPHTSRQTMVQLLLVIYRNTRINSKRRRRNTTGLWRSTTENRLKKGEGTGTPHHQSKN